MTIYAIVNNIIGEKERSCDMPASWVLISSSGILQGGNPFFVPDFANRFEARLSLAVRIGKLGKGVAARFVARYIEAVAPCVVFVASDFLDNLRNHGLPWTQAISYDKCTALGRFIKMPYENIGNCKVELSLESKECASRYLWTKEFLKPGLEETISILSRDNTLKTGDIILLGMTREGPIIQSDQRAGLILNGEVSLKFNIR